MLEDRLLVSSMIVKVHKTADFESWVARGQGNKAWCQKDFFFRLVIALKNKASGSNVQMYLDKEDIGYTGGRRRQECKKETIGMI